MAILIVLNSTLKMAGATKARGVVYDFLVWYGAICVVAMAKMFLYHATASCGAILTCMPERYLTPAPRWIPATCIQSSLPASAATQLRGTCHTHSAQPVDSGSQQQSVLRVVHKSHTKALAWDRKGICVDRGCAQGSALKQRSINCVRAMAHQQILEPTTEDLMCLARQLANVPTLLREEVPPPHGMSTCTHLGQPTHTPHRPHWHPSRACLLALTSNPSSCTPTCSLPAAPTSRRSSAPT